MDEKTNTTAQVKATATPVVKSFVPNTFSQRGPRPFGTFGRRPTTRDGEGIRPGGFGRGKNPRKGFASREARAKPEFDQKILNIRRVTRVTSGGKRLNFSVAMVAGNRKGSVGVGTGKAVDTSLAIEKALRNAKKNMIKLNLVKNNSIPHIVMAKYCSGTISIMPTPGKGVTAGSAVKYVIELAGINDVTAKIISPSKNKLNMARATIEALSAFAKKKGTVEAKPIPVLPKEIKPEEVKK